MTSAPFADDMQMSLVYDHFLFMSRVADMYWLDGGHAGGKNTWITSRSLLETLTRLEVNMFVHVSPYQVQDEGRPWIGREEKAFTGLLNKLGAKARNGLGSWSKFLGILTYSSENRWKSGFRRAEMATPH
ncbi:jg7698, partial [Pararge aegeria aegeria]